MRALIKKATINIAAMFIALAVLIAGLGFLWFAVYLAMLEHLSPPMAALTTGLAAIVLAALIVFLGRAIAGRAQKKQRRDASTLAAELGDLLGEEFLARAAAHPHATLITSLLSGFAVGALPELRDVLRDLLRKR
jgi:hypothetical protein